MTLIYFQKVYTALHRQEMLRLFQMAQLRLILRTMYIVQLEIKWLERVSMENWFRLST